MLVNLCIYFPSSLPTSTSSQFVVKVKGLLPSIGYTLNYFFMCWPFFFTVLVCIPFDSLYYSYELITFEFVNRLKILKFHQFITSH